MKSLLQFLFMSAFGLVLMAGCGGPPMADKSPEEVRAATADPMKMGTPPTGMPPTGDPNAATTTPAP